MNTTEAQTIGRAACLSGSPRVPALNATIMTALKEQPTFRQANAIMRAFLSGWDGARVEAMMAAAK